MIHLSQLGLMMKQEIKFIDIWDFKRMIQYFQHQQQATQEQGRPMYH